MVTVSRGRLDAIGAAKKWNRSHCISNRRAQRPAGFSLTPQIRAGQGDHSVIDNQERLPGRHPAVIGKIVTDDRELGLVMTFGLRVMHLARLNEGVQFLLSIFQAHPDIRIFGSSPEKIEIDAQAIAGVERGNRAVGSIISLKGDRGIGFCIELWGHRVEEILLCLPELEALVERDRQRGGIFDLVRLRRFRSTADQGEAKQSQTGFHERSIKREEDGSVNRRHGIGNTLDLPRRVSSAEGA